MTTAQPSLLSRHDTILGVCEGLGEDLRINANYLRAAFAVALFFNPLGVIIAYLGAGLVVAATRWLYPARKAIAAQPVKTETSETALAPALVGDNDAPLLPLAEAA